MSFSSSWVFSLFVVAWNLSKEINYGTPLSSLFHSYFFCYLSHLRFFSKMESIFLLILSTNHKFQRWAFLSKTKIFNEFYTFVIKNETPINYKVLKLFLTKKNKSIVLATKGTRSNFKGSKSKSWNLEWIIYICKKR